MTANIGVSWLQLGGNVSVSVAAALTNYTILPAPGANLRYRLIGVDVCIDETAAATTRVRGNLRIGAGQIFGTFTLIAGQKADKTWDFQDGFVLNKNAAFTIQAIATVAATPIYVATRYVLEVG